MPELTIRPAGEADAAALRRLAELDSARMPEGEVLLALVGGEPRAAYALEEGRAIADPFRPTAHLLGLLARHAGADPGTEAVELRRDRALPRRSAPWPA